MAYGIGRNIALLKWEINEADFLWNWNYFSSLIQIYELCFQHKILNLKLYNYLNLYILKYEYGRTVLSMSSPYIPRIIKLS